MNTVKKILGVSLVLLAIAILVSISELIYIYNNHPERIFNYYLKNLSQVKLPVNALGKKQRSISALILYKYLEREEKRVKNIEPCDPLCLDYNEFQFLLNFFEDLEKSNSISGLTAMQKSMLYYWMAVINVWHNDNEKTSIFLEKSISFSDQNSQAVLFHEDLKRLSEIAASPESQSYFRDRLSSTNKKKQYEEKYFAKAAFELGKIYLSANQTKETELYLNKSISINPWRLDPYLLLADVYISQNKPEISEKLLEKCLTHLKQDGLLCKQKLEQI